MSKLPFDAKGVVGSINHTKAMLDYVRRMTAKVQYTFIPTASTQPGGGIRSQQTDHPLRNAPKQGAIPVIPKKPNKHPLCVTKSSQVVPKNLEEISAAKPKLDKSLPTHDDKKHSVLNSTDGTQVILIGENQSPVSEVAKEPDFGHPDMHKNTIEEPELEPEQVPSIDKVEQETQSGLLMIDNKCQSNDTDVKDKPGVKLTDVTNNGILSKPQENKQSKEKAAVEERDESDEEDLPNLTMSKLTSVFTLP